jgi:hypothetical protein
MDCYGGRKVHGHTVGSNGRKTSIASNSRAGPSNIKSIAIVGKESRNSAEAALDDILFGILTGAIDLETLPLAAGIWLDQELSLLSFQTRQLTGLNVSQSKVVCAMTESENGLTVVHGGHFGLFPPCHADRYLLG